MSELYAQLNLSLVNLTASTFQGTVVDDQAFTILPIDGQNYFISIATGLHGSYSSTLVTPNPGTGVTGFVSVTQNGQTHSTDEYLYWVPNISATIATSSQI